MNELPILDLVGWVGFAGLGLFYWLLGSGKVLQAYIYGTLGALAWLVVGIATAMGYATELPSLITMEIMVVIMNVRGIINWRKQATKVS